MPTSSAAVSGAFAPTPIYTHTTKLGQPIESAESFNRTNEINTDLSNVNDIPSTSQSTQGQIFASRLVKLSAAAAVTTVVCAVVAVALAVVLTNSKTSTTTATTATTTTSRTSTSATSSTTSTTSATTTSTTTVTTTTAAPSSICATSSGNFQFTNNTFIYSPTSQQYAAGMLYNQFGIYIAYGNHNVTSTRIWGASQSSTANTAFLAGQNDRNLVVYTSSPNGVLWASGTNNGGSGLPFCLQMLDSGNLIWIDNTATIIWQSNSAQTG